MRKFVEINFSFILFLLLLDSCSLMQVANIEKRHYRSGFYVEKTTKSNGNIIVQTKIKFDETAEAIRSLGVTDSSCFSNFSRTKDTSAPSLTASLQTNRFTKKQIRPTKAFTITSVRKNVIIGKNSGITDKKNYIKKHLKNKSDWETFWMVLAMILAYSILLGLIYLVALAWLIILSSIFVAVLLAILSLFILFVLLYLLSYIISPRVC